MKIDEILELPTVVDNVHESIFRSYHILNYIISLVERQDSKETILEIADFLNTYPDTAIKLPTK